ncbi:MAG: glycosyltransferase [Ferruginibacter sp.]
MKVVLCLNHFLPAVIAGTEVYTLNLAKALKVMGAEVVVLIPNLGVNVTDEYYYEDIRVIRYAENSIEDRNMILGKTKPGGVATFINILKNENPDIVHFQELAPGKGISIFHVEAAWSLKIKIVLTCHVANYSCNTGNLKYKDEDLCDGEIKLLKCTACSYHARDITGVKRAILSVGARLMFSGGINSTNWNTSLGTALGFPFIIATKKEELLRLEKMVNKIVVLTQWYKRILEINDIQPRKLLYISQGLPGRSIATLSATSSAPPLKLVFIGRISYLKGVHLILKALQQLSPSKISLDIYGADREDEYALNCKQIAATMHNVKWIGSIDSHKVIDLLAGYDLLCLPSTFSEMSPLVIQEAFAAGIPVLASDVYGNAEQIKDGINGWLFKFKSSADLQNKLTRLIDQPGLINEAKKAVPATKAFAEVASQYYELYNSILEHQ